MSAEELLAEAEKAAAEEAKADQAEPSAPEPEPVEAGPAPAPITDAEMLLPLATSGVRVVGGIVCRRARVNGLDDGEVDGLARCVSELLIVYNVGPSNPRAAAWLNLGLVMAVVAGNRRRLPPEPKADKPEPAAEAKPADGDGTTGAYGSGDQLDNPAAGNGGAYGTGEPLDTPPVKPAKPAKPARGKTRASARKAR